MACGGGISALRPSPDPVTRSGKVQGPAERVTPIEGLKAITLWGARQHFEDQTKGSIEVGKLADLVILDRNPALSALTAHDGPQLPIRNLYWQPRLSGCGRSNA